MGYSVCTIRTLNVREAQLTLMLPPATSSSPPSTCPRPVRISTVLPVSSPDGEGLTEVDPSLTYSRRLPLTSCPRLIVSIITVASSPVTTYVSWITGERAGDPVTETLVVPSPARLEDSGTLPEPHPSVSSTAPLATQVCTLMYHTSEAGSDKTLDCKSCKAYSNYNKFYSCEKKK